MLGAFYGMIDVIYVMLGAFSRMIVIYYAGRILRMIDRYIIMLGESRGPLFTQWFYAKLGPPPPRHRSIWCVGIVTSAPCQMAYRYCVHYYYLRCAADVFDCVV